MALPAAAATSSVGRGASADDVHELQEHLHTSAADQHADQADEGGLGHNQRLGEAGAARDEGAAARGVEQPRFGARGGAQAAVVQVACFCGQQPLEWASDALEPSLRRVELRGDDTSAAGGAAPRRAAARVEGGAEGVNLARGEELLGARRAARSTGEVDALGRAFDSPQGVRASAAAAMAISPPGPQDSPSLSLSPLVAAAVTDGDEGLGRCDSPLGDEHLVSGRAATPPPGGLKTPGSEGARIDDERAAARAVGTLSPAPGPIAPRPYTRAVARGAVETERRAARHSADAQLDSMAFSQHGSSAACVSSRTRGHTGVDSSIGSTGSKHYEGGSVALPSARGIVMNNVGDVHARAVAPVGMSVGVEPSAAGAALPAPQDMPAPASPLRPSHERGCKCGECNDWRRLRWQRRAAQPVPVLPVERFAHEGGLVTKNDAALVRLQHARRLMGARDPLLWGTIPFAELGVPLEARTTLHDVEALIEARQLQLDGAGQAGVQRGPTGKRLRGMGDAQARAGDSMSAMSAAAPSDVSRRVRFALASDGPLPGHVMADVSVVTAHELSLVRAERAGEAASSASSAGTAHVVTGSSTRVALRQAAFAAGRKRLAERAVTGVDAELGMGVRVTWQAVARHAGADVADEGALQRVGFACIQGLHEGEAGNVVAHLRYVEDGDVWVDTAQHFAPGDREGALEAYQCARREGRPRKHMVPLSELTRGGLAVGASARTAATLGYGRAPEWLTRDAVAALDGDGIGLGARRFASAFACALRGHAVKAAGLSSRDDPPDWRARLSDAPSVGADAGQQPFRLQSASEPGMASCAPAPKGLEWAMWLCAQLADASLLNDLVALGDDIQHVRVMPWGLLYEAAAHACRLDVIEELVPALSLGGCWRSSTDVMLDQAYIGDVRWLPAHGKRLRDRGICTLPEVAAWLSVNAEDVLSRKQAAWRAGRLRLDRCAFSTRLPRSAAEAHRAVRIARDALVSVHDEARSADGALLAPPAVIVSEAKEHYGFAWNCGGASVVDARPERRAAGQRVGRDDDQQAAQVAEDLRHADARDVEVGSGSSLKHKGNRALDAAITHAVATKACVMILAETGLRSESAAAAVSDYIGARLNWRAQRPMSKTVGALPEYDACVKHSITSADQASVLVAWDPDVCELVATEEILPGRILRVRLRMLADGLAYDVLACYMPQQGRAVEEHSRAWEALIEAISTSPDEYLVTGDLNVEPAKRRGGKTKRPGEPFFDQILGGLLFEAGNPKRLGHEVPTYIVEAGGEAPAEDGSGDAGSVPVGTRTCIDHVLVGPGAAGRVRAPPRNAVHVDTGLTKYHRAVYFNVTTVAAKRLQQEATLRPKLSRMPQSPLVKSRGAGKRRTPLGKRAIERAREMPDGGVDEHGELVDDLDVAESDELEGLPETEYDAEPIGWDAYADGVVAAVNGRLAEFVAKRERDVTEAVEELQRLRGGSFDEDDGAVLARARALAERDFGARNGTSIEVIMRTAMSVARDAIGRVPVGAARAQSTSERLRRLLDFYVDIETLIEDMEAIHINFANIGAVPQRWRAKSGVLNDGLRDLFGGRAEEQLPEERKQAELRLVQKLIRTTRDEHDELRASIRLDYANAQLAQAAEKHGFGRAAADIMRRERPGAVSRKDKGPGGSLTALRVPGVDGGDERLLTGAEGDEAVAQKVEEANKPSIVDLEAAGHLIDQLDGARVNLRGGPTARASGAAMQIVGRVVFERRQVRVDARRERRLRLRQPPVGMYVEVANSAFPQAHHRGRIHLTGRRGSILGNPFRMGTSGRGSWVRF